MQLRFHAQVALSAASSEDACGSDDMRVALSAASSEDACWSDNIRVAPSAAYPRARASEAERCFNSVNPRPRLFGARAEVVVAGWIPHTGLRKAPGTWECPEAG
eukprot:361284-Chlamydomonas_euryale.AAC.6